MAPSDELEQRRPPSAGNQVNAAPAPAVAAVRAAEGHELLASERYDAVAAVPSFYPDSAFVDVDTHASLCRLRPGRHGSTELCIATHRRPQLIPAETSYCDGPCNPRGCANLPEDYGWLRALGQPMAM